MTEVQLSEGKTFLITGAANGLGAAYLEPFLKEGAKSIAIVDIDEEAGKALSEKLNKIYDNKTIFVKCDISKEEDIAQAFDYVLKEFKQIDVLINNAGVMNDAENVWRKACDVTWQGLVSFTRKSVNHMRTDEGGKGGTIINICSVVAFVKVPILPSYTGCKAAVLQYSLSLSTPPFFEKTGIRILTMCFGPTQTSLLTNLVEKSIDKELAAEVSKIPITAYQRVDSAVAGVLKMFREGIPGSVWLASHDRPAEDITHIISRVQEELTYLAYNGLAAAEQKQK